MIIRSQDKRKITTDLDLYIEPRDSQAIGNVTCWIKNKTMGILGTYSSWEEAIMVLDMVQDAYEKASKWYISNNGEISYTLVPVVFEMPRYIDVKREETERGENGFGSSGKY